MNRFYLNAACEFSAYHNFAAIDHEYIFFFALILFLYFNRPVTTVGVDLNNK